MKHIWIVDDNEERGRTLAQMSKLLDSEATLHLSARSAVHSLLRGKPPDLIVIDLDLPESSGPDLVEFLRRRPEWKELPIVILSSLTGDLLRDRALSLGGDASLTTPVILEELEEAMTAAFSKHKIGE